ncbi:MAG: nuclear transport factor 2 family protein, partial [Alcaligenaceae bacterium]
MNLPKVIEALVAAQNAADSNAFAQCFAADAVATDEGKTYTGRAAIEGWIAQANETYNSKMKPVSYDA